MKLMRFKKLIVGVAVLTAPLFAMAQSAQQLINKYTPLAGGEANAQALVNGLRSGTEVVLLMEVVVVPPAPPPTAALDPAPGLVPPPPMGTMMLDPTSTNNATSTSNTTSVIIVEVRFTPLTGSTGFGNVDNALTLAQGSLASLNIFTVSAANLRAVLMGGQDYPVTTPGGQLIVPGILTLRSQGLGWGEIAKEVGAKL